MDKKTQALYAQYAKSLVDVAQEQDQTQVIHDDLEGLLAVFDETGLDSYLKQITLDQAGADQILDSLAAACSPYVQRFLGVIKANRRQADLLGILQVCQEALAQATGTYQVQVRTAVPLRDDQKDRLLALAKNRLGIQHGQLQESLDPRLIGGFVINAKNQVIDTSIRSQLQDLRSKLK